MKQHRTAIPIRFRPHYNIANKLYEVEELGITYSMPIETTRLLEAHFGSNHKATMADWYRWLSNADKKTVIVTGGQKGKQDDFYPDLPVYDDF